MLMQQFIENNGLTVTWQPALENPYMSDGMASDSVHFKACITSEENGTDRWLNTYYSCGSGIVESWARDNKITERGATLISIAKYRNSVDGDATYRAIMKRAKADFRPDLADLLDCLASDAACIDNARDFTDWANDLGYDDDSIKARKTYDICVEQSRELEHLLGRDQLQILMYEVERL